MKTVFALVLVLSLLSLLASGFSGLSIGATIVSGLLYGLTCGKSHNRPAGSLGDFIMPALLVGALLYGASKIF